MPSSDNASVLDALGRPRVAAVVVTAACALWLALLVATTTGQAKPNDQTTVFGDRPNAAEARISTMDGVHFAQLAVDPLYRNTVENFRDDPSRASYRSLRPVQGWVTWALSFGGRRGLLAPAILVLAAVATGALVLAVDAVARALRRRTELPMAVLLAPGVAANLTDPGLCETLATVVVLAGAACWLRDRRGLAVALFCIAALTRETTLAVPAGIALAELATGRRLRPVLPLLAAPATYLAWGAVVAARVAPINGSQAGETGFEPITGLVNAIPSWGPAEAITAATILLAAAAILRRREPILTGIVVAHGVLLLSLGTIVWTHWWGFGRVVLPLSVLALVGGRLPVASERADDAAGSTDADPPTVRNLQATA